MPEDVHKGVAVEDIDPTDGARGDAGLAGAAGAAHAVQVIIRVVGRVVIDQMRKPLDIQPAAWTGNFSESLRIISAIVDELRIKAELT